MRFQMVQLDTGLRSGHVALERWSVLSDALSDGSVRHAGQARQAREADNDPDGDDAECCDLELDGES